MQNISGFGLQVRLTASNTYPIGIDLTQFATDITPFDVPPMTMGDAVTDLNGGLVTWSKPVPIYVSLGIVADTADDFALATLAEMNRVGRGKQGARDIIGLTAVYPSNRTIIFTNGIIVEAPAGTGVAGEGKLSSKIYKFAFENKIGV